MVECRHGDCKKLPSHQPSTPSGVITWYQAMPSPSTGPATTVAMVPVGKAVKIVAESAGSTCRLSGPELTLVVVPAAKMGHVS